MSIQWFPGHMTAAKNNAEKAMEINDVIVRRPTNSTGTNTCDIKITKSI